MALSPGTRFGPYDIAGEIGAGGMGVVYRAEHSLIGKTAAVKLLREEVSRKRNVINRFFNEAKAIGRVGLLISLHRTLNDPNLLTPTGDSSAMPLPVSASRSANRSRSCSTTGWNACGPGSG